MRVAVRSLDRARPLCASVLPSRVMRSKASASSVEYNAFGSKVKQNRAERPLSPHVAIYAFPLPAITSITTRFTGLGLSLGAFVLAVPMLTNPAGVAASLVALKAGSPLLTASLKFVIAWPIVFHTLSGIRHHIWDFSSRGLESLEVIDRWSRYLVWTSLALATFLALVSF